MSDVTDCPLCKLPPEIQDVTEAGDPNPISQCVCTCCGISGAKSPHEETAVFVWNRIHLKEPKGHG